MIQDALFNFTGSGAGQAIAGTAAQLSTNVYDAGSAKKLFGGAAARGPRVCGVISAVGGTNPTFRASLVGADDAALSTNPITIADTGATRVLVAGDLPYEFDLTPAGQLDAKRYYGISFLQTGTSPTATVAMQVAEAAQSIRTGP